MKHQHRHRAAKSIDRPFFGPVSQRENRAAHGNVCVVETCRCGALRRTNVNQRHEETSGWLQPAADLV